MRRKFACSEYGFACNYEIDGEEVDAVREFGRHTSREHGIEYSQGALGQMLLRKKEHEDHDIRLSKEELTLLVTLLDLFNTSLPLSGMVEGMDHQVVQRILVKLLEQVH